MKKRNNQKDAGKMDMPFLDKFMVSPDNYEIFKFGGTSLRDDERGLRTMLQYFSAYFTEEQIKENMKRYNLQAMFKWSKDFENLETYGKCFKYVLFLMNDVCIFGEMQSESANKALLETVDGDIQILQLAEDCNWTIVVFSLAHEIAHAYLASIGKKYSDKRVFDFNTKTVTLNSGYKMPLNGIGTYSLLGDTCVSSVTEALKRGVRLIDTAYMYSNEKEVGEVTPKRCSRIKP